MSTDICAAEDETNRRPKLKRFHRLGQPGQKAPILRAIPAWPTPLPRCAGAAFRPRYLTLAVLTIDTGWLPAPTAPLDVKAPVAPSIVYIEMLFEFASAA